MKALLMKIVMPVVRLMSLLAVGMLSVFMLLWLACVTAGLAVRKLILRLGKGRDEEAEHHHFR